MLQIVSMCVYILEIVSEIIFIKMKPVKSQQHASSLKYAKWEKRTLNSKHINASKL